VANSWTKHGFSIAGHRNATNWYKNKGSLVAAFVCLKNIFPDYFLAAVGLAASFTRVAPLPMRLRR